MVTKTLLLKVEKRTFGWSRVNSLNGPCRIGTDTAAPVKEITALFFKNEIQSSNALTFVTDKGSFDSAQ